MNYDYLADSFALSFSKALKLKLIIFLKIPVKRAFFHVQYEFLKFIFFIFLLVLRMMKKILSVFYRISFNDQH